MSVFLAFLVFAVLMCLLHLLLRAIPGLCPLTPGGEGSTSTFCLVFNNWWHKISIYDMTPHSQVSQSPLSSPPTLEPLNIS